MLLCGTGHSKSNEQRRGYANSSKAEAYKDHQEGHRSSPAVVGKGAEACQAKSRMRRT
jgi:hypothetical protein